MYGPPYPGAGQPGPQYPGPPGYYPPPGYPPPGYPPPGFPPPPKKSNKALLIGIGAAIVAVIAVVAVVLLNRGDQNTHAQTETTTTQTSPKADPGKPIDRTKLAATVKAQLDAKTGEQSATVMCGGDLAAAVGSTQRCVLIRSDGMGVGLTVSVVGNDPDTGKLQLHIEADPKPLFTPPTFAPGTGTR